MLIGRDRGHFFSIFLSPRATLLTPDWSSSQDTCSWLAERVIYLVSSFRAATTRFLSSFLQFDFLSRIVCNKKKNTWKSSATATKEIPKGELPFLVSNRLFASKAKSVIGFVWFKNWNHSWPRPSAFTLLWLLPMKNNQTIITVSFWWEEGAGQYSVEEITLLVPSLDPVRFSKR